MALYTDLRPGASLVPFHKLTQWLCYSIVEGIESEAGWTVEGKEAQTVLPEVSLVCERVQPC